jgi:methyl-accepting chemotaxis protein
MKNLENSLLHIQSNNQDIIKRIETSNSHFSDIAQAVSEISAKTKIIDDIVFQTKLLSFNASVEAARAGKRFFCGCRRNWKISTH